jgi:hypothetical protein
MAHVARCKRSYWLAGSWGHSRICKLIIRARGLLADTVIIETPKHIAIRILQLGFMSPHVLAPTTAAGILICGPLIVRG